MTTNIVFVIFSVNISNSIFCTVIYSSNHIYEASLSDKHIGAVNVRQVTAVTKFSSIAECLRFVFVMLIFVFLSRNGRDNVCMIQKIPVSVITFDDV